MLCNLNCWVLASFSKAIWLYLHCTVVLPPGFDNHLITLEPACWDARQPGTLNVRAIFKFYLKTTTQLNNLANVN